MPRIKTRLPREGILRILASNLHRLLNQKGWTQSDLARQAAKHMPDKRFGRWLVSEYCAARTLPMAVHLHAMAKAFEVEPQEILPLRTYPEIDPDNPPWDLKNIGDGTAWLKINQIVPLTIALRIVEMIQATSPPADSPPPSESPREPSSGGLRRGN